MKKEKRKGPNPLNSTNISTMVNMILTGVYLFTAKICLVNPFA